MKNNISKALTWDELANLYDLKRYRHRPARTLPLDTIFEWAKRQADIFYVDPDEGTIHFYK